MMLRSKRNLDENYTRKCLFTNNSLERDHNRRATFVDDCKATLATGKTHQKQLNDCKTQKIKMDPNLFIWTLLKEKPLPTNQY